MEKDVQHTSNEHRSNNDSNIKCTNSQKEEFYGYQVERNRKVPKSIYIIVTRSKCTLTIDGSPVGYSCHCLLPNLLPSFVVPLNTCFTSSYTFLTMLHNVHVTCLFVVISF